MYHLFVRSNFDIIIIIIIKFFNFTSSALQSFSESLPKIFEGNDYMPFYVFFLSLLGVDFPHPLIVLV